jgi:hypothetical protein
MISAAIILTVDNLRQIPMRAQKIGTGQHEVRCDADAAMVRPDIVEMCGVRDGRDTKPTDRPHRNDDDGRLLRSNRIALCG